MKTQQQIKDEIKELKLSRHKYYESYNFKKVNEIDSRINILEWILGK